MSTDPTPALSPADAAIARRRDRTRADHLAVLLDAAGDRPITGSQRRCLEWLAGWERHVIEDIAELIRRR